MYYFYALIAVIVLVIIENNDPRNWRASSKEGTIKAGILLYVLACYIIYNL